MGGKWLIPMSNIETTEDPHENFVTLYVRHEAAVFSFVLGIVRNSADAQDVVQRASMTMWRRFDQFTSGTSFRNWAFQVAKNEALNHLTKMRRDRHVFSDELVHLLAERSLERFDDLNSRRLALDFCVDKLPTGDRSMVAGCYAEGSNIKSYAERSGATANTIYKRLNRVRGLLAGCIERRLGLEAMT